MKTDVLARAQISDDGDADQAQLKALIARVAQSDRVAFKQLYEATAGRLFSVALRLLKQREAAEEVVQEAYLAIWRKAAQYCETRGNAGAWMCMIVRHRAIDRMRMHERRPQETAIDPLAETEPMTLAAAPAFESGAQTRDVRRCLSRLSDTQQRAITLAFFDGLTHEELAAQLNAPLGTVKSWVRRGLLALKECLEP